MESDGHCFSDSDTEYDGLRSNSLNNDLGDDECAWAHPYESMELITPAAKLVLRDFPVVDLAHEAEAAGKREGKLNALLAFSQDGDSSRNAGVTRRLGQGSWKIRVGQSGGVGRVVHEENPGANQKMIVPCVGREGTGKVLVGSLGGSGWEFTDVVRTDKRATNLLWPKDKCSIGLKGSAKTGLARLPTDIAQMTPEERLQRERRDEKNRKERERRAQLKLDKLAKKEEELALAAAAAAAVQPGSSPPGGPNVSSAPTTPAPSTPPESSEAGTPHNVKVIRQDFVKVEAKPVEVTAGSHVAAGPGVKTAASSRQAIPQPSISAGAAPQHPSSAAGAAAASMAVQSRATDFPAAHAPAEAATPLASSLQAPSSCPTPLPAKQGQEDAAARVSTMRQVPPAPAQASEEPNCQQLTGQQLTSPSPTPTTAATVDEPAKVSVSAQSSQAQVLQSAQRDAKQYDCATGNAASPGQAEQKVTAPTKTPIASMEAAEPTSSSAHKDGDDTMKENVEDEEINSAQIQERGRCMKVEDLNGKQALSKRRRLASLSPVEVNLRNDAKRAVRPRGVQRA